jgi:dehydrogenase/reductase SDR family member 12
MNKLSVAGFTNLGYKLHSRSFEPIDVDMTGKTVVITGASGGLGLETARSLAAMGARVVIVGRSREKLDAAQTSIKGEAASHLADLSLMSEVSVFARRILSNEKRIDVLVNNVGVLLPQRSVTAEGMETTLATNLAGHFLLTNLLVPRLRESAPARVINVSSGGMYSERIRPDDLQFSEGEYTGAAAYARTKRGQVILTEMWAERLRGVGIVAHAMHPGWARTAGVAESLPAFHKIMRPLLRTPAEGADTIVWLAVGVETGSSTGKFWFDRRQAATHLIDGTRETAADRERLWDGLVELTGVDLPSDRP